MKSLFLASCAVAALIVSTPAGAWAPAGSAASDADSVATPHFGAWGYDQTGEDASVPAGKDFYLHANGQWLAHTDIPADRTRFGNFDKLVILSENRTRQIIEAAAAGQIADPDAAKIGAAYTAFMNEARIEALDAKPLTADLDAIHAETSLEDVAVVMGSANANFQSVMFETSIQPDEKAPTHYAVYMDTAGMGLPDRDYYLEPSFAEKKAAYQAYVAQTLGQIGWSDPAGSAKAIVDLETQIAQASWSIAESRDVDKTYNPMSPAELSAYAPGFDFKRLLQAAGLGDVNRVVVSDNTAFPKIAQILAATPLDTIKAWQAFHVTDNASPYLSKRFVDARFAFFGHTLGGQPQNRPRWKRGVSFTQGVLGEAVGRLYVARYFTPEAKAKIDDLVHQLRIALGHRIERLTWMSPATKAKAEEKLAKFTVKIGYPVKWHDYGPLVVTADDLYGDAERSGAYEWQRQVHRLNQPVDKLEWDMTPQTVNAYYNPTNNEIVFPAAILQPPFFDPKADPAVNYGGIGAVIGHEMTHGFDDQGRKSNGDGALDDWWTAEDAAKFEAQTKHLGAQYSAFQPLPGAHIKGDQTMGENIADLGGVLIALDAYHASLHGKPAPVVGGLTGDQRFFLSFAQIWRERIRDDTLRQRLVTDPHSPAHYRVDGVLPNVDAWYRAFQIKPGAAMYAAPDQRVRIW